MNRPYHHGDLRRALLDAALAVVESEGVRALTLRAVARQVGVTHAAPYRHFKDKTDLLAAVASEGFRLLAQATEAARDAVPDAPLLGLQAIGVAYVRFALAHPAHYRVMFGPSLGELPADHPFHADAQRAFAVLTGCMAAADAAGALPATPAPEAPPGPPTPDVRAVRAWATVHGLSLLLVDGLLPVPLADDALDAYVAGVLSAA